MCVEAKPSYADGWSAATATVGRYAAEEGTKETLGKIAIALSSPPVVVTVAVVEVVQGVNSLRSYDPTERALGGARAGAISGAAIGSFIPVVGTAAGAIIGGVSGLVCGWYGRLSF